MRTLKEDGRLEMASEKTYNRVTELVYDLLNEYDIDVWKDIDYIDLADKWVELVKKYWNDDDKLKSELQKYLLVE